MAVIDDAASAAERHDGRVDALRQRADLGGCVQSAAADPQHRRLRLVQQLRQRGDPVGIGQRVRMARQRILRRDLGRRGELVPRHLQRDRAGAARQHLLEGARGEVGGLARMLDALGPFQQAAQRGELVRQFVQLAAAAADHHAGHLAGQAQHRRVHAPGGGERRGGVEHARARHDGVGRRAPGRAGVAERHVGGGLLVPRVDQAQAVGGAREGVEQAVGLHARQAEHGVDAVAQQAVDDGFSAGHAWHGLVLAVEVMLHVGMRGSAGKVGRRRDDVRPARRIRGRAFRRPVGVRHPDTVLSGRCDRQRCDGRCRRCGRASWCRYEKSARSLALIADRR